MKKKTPIVKLQRPAKDATKIKKRKVVKKSNKPVDHTFKKVVKKPTNFVDHTLKKGKVVKKTSKTIDHTFQKRKVAKKRSKPVDYVDILKNKMDTLYSGEEQKKKRYATVLGEEWVCDECNQHNSLSVKLCTQCYKPVFLPEDLGMDAPLVKKYKWDGMLVDLLSQTVEYSLPVDTLLQRCIYSIRGGGGSDRHLVKGQLQEKFDYHLKNHSNIRVVDGVAEIINKPAHTVNSQVETTEKAVSSDTAENNPPTEPVYNKFNWKKSMRLVVEGSGGEISLKKLSKKLMLAYVDFNDSLSKEKLKSLCMKKIKSSTVLVIDKDVVKLK